MIHIDRIKTPMFDSPPLSPSHAVRVASVLVRKHIDFVCTTTLDKKATIEVPAEMSNLLNRILVEVEGTKHG